MSIGIVSPGAMGSALGRAWVSAGVRVVATVAGRSDRTRELADGLELLPSLDDVLTTSDLICSVVPPAQAVPLALELASSCQRLQISPVVVDLNAIAPSTVSEVQALLTAAGCEFFDGSISGTPPTPTGRTEIYLSGPRTELLNDLQAPGIITTVVGPEPGAASAVKMCTASMYKGLAALLSQALHTSAYFDVTDFVLTDLRKQLPNYVDRAAMLIATSASKADRYADEMRQISLAQGAAGADPELFRAMAKVYDSISGSRLAKATPEQAGAAADLGEVLSALADR